MRETCCQFGEDRHLAGVLTEPDRRGRPRGGVVLITAGLVPSFGPFRLYVELARRLAADGFMTLRFDVEGIGDSAITHPSLSFVDRTGLAARAAAEYLITNHGAENLALGGLCSGAEDAFRAAETDPAVRHVVMIDPFSYRTAGWLPRNVVHRAMRRTRRALGLYCPYPRGPSAEYEGAARVVSYEYLSHADSSRILGVLLERRTRVHFVYTGGAAESFNHPGQLAKMFEGIDFDDLVTVDHFPWMDHTQMLAEDRRELVEAIARRLTSSAEDSVQAGGVEAGARATAR